MPTLQPAPHKLNDNVCVVIDSSNPSTTNKDAIVVWLPTAHRIPGTKRVQLPL